MPITCKCRICKNNETQTVNDKFEDGLSFSEIQVYLKSKYIEISDLALMRHFESFGYNLSANDSTNEIEITPTQVISKEPLNYDLNNINFDSYNFDVTDSKSVMSYLQKCHLNLYLRQLQIVTAEQENYLVGDSPNPPRQSIMLLEKLLKMMDKISGISLIANQSQAIQILERMGYKITSETKIINED